MIMAFINRLEITQFRGIQKLDISDFSNINLIVGDNNSGKTTFLEAITLLESPDNIKNMLLNASKRDSNNNSKFELFLEMFPKNQFNERSIHLKSTINNYKNDLKIKGNINEIIILQISANINEILLTIYSLPFLNQFIIS